MDFLEMMRLFWDFLLRHRQLELNRLLFLERMDSELMEMSKQRIVAFEIQNSQIEMIYRGKGR
jgi:hypothetical protein